ncbi:MAG: c-type cytochrome [Curvibacter sp.]|nr:c-type cytochrome [Curvibacter sp.]
MKPLSNSGPGVPSRPAFPVLVLAGWAVAALLPPAARAQDVHKGQQVFAQCAACHASTASNGVGPGLQGVLGRKAGSAPGFRYSHAMKNFGKTWDAETLKAYIADPQAVVPGNHMPFSGLADAGQRADLVAYLATLK